MKCSWESCKGDCFRVTGQKEELNPSRERSLNIRFPPEEYEALGAQSVTTATTNFKTSPTPDTNLTLQT